ncbi:MAG: hypothetical protein ABIN61_01700 [candidate division WOR-3 bacterium]
MLFFSILLSITPTKAAFSSFIIPGSGDLLLGNKSRGFCFMAIEAGIWFNFYNSLKIEEKFDKISRNFAIFYASANPYNNEKKYFDAMENFLTNVDYNEYIKEKARKLYPDTLDEKIMEERIKKRKEYIEQYSYIDPDSWSWQTQKFADTYRDLRKDKRRASQRATNIIGLALFNRTVSFFVTYLWGKRVSVNLKENEIEIGFSF